MYTIIQKYRSLKKIVACSLFIHSKRKWARFDMRANFIDDSTFTFVSDDWELLRKFDSIVLNFFVIFLLCKTVVKINDHNNYHLIFWSGQINNTQLRLDSFRNSEQVPSVELHSALTFDTEWEHIFCCSTQNNYQVKIAV